jgi:hypothetical protein
VKFAPVETEKSAAEKAAGVLVAVCWLVYLILFAVSPVIVWAVWKALL